MGVVSNWCWNCLNIYKFKWMLPYQVCVCPVLAHRSLALIDMHEHLSLTQFKISSEIYIVVCWLESLSQVQCVAYFMIFFSYFSRGLMDRYLRINRLLERVCVWVIAGLLVLVWESVISHIGINSQAPSLNGQFSYRHDTKLWVFNLSSRGANDSLHLYNFTLTKWSSSE